MILLSYAAPLLALTLLTSCQIARSAFVDQTPQIAAIAIRDDVPDYQKFATRHFTLAFIAPAYSGFGYFVEGAPIPWSQTRAEFLSALERALATYEAVDLFLLAHSNSYLDWIAELDPNLRRHLRLVYNTGCGDAAQGQRWLDLGARAYVGHPGDNIAPLFDYFFLPEWTAGRRLEDAVASANARTREDLFDGAVGWMTEVTEDLDAPARYWQATRALVYGDGRITIDTPSSKARSP